MGLFLATGCHAPPQQSPQWDDATACPYVDDDGDCVHEPVLNRMEEPRRQIDDFEGFPAGTEYVPPGRTDYLKMDPGLGQVPRLFGTAGSYTARTEVEKALRNGEQPATILLRPDRLVAAYAPELRSPAHHGALLHAEQVTAPWDHGTILLLMGLKASDEARAPLRKVKVSAVWSWLAIDQLRSVASIPGDWRRQDATPWTAVFQRLEPGSTHVSMFELRPFQWKSENVHVIGGLTDANKMDLVENLGHVRLRFVDRYGIPGEMFGRIRPSPIAVEDASAAMRMAVATVAWARKLRYDRQLSRMRWSEIEALVPDEGVDPQRRDALREMIQLSRKLRRRG